MPYQADFIEGEVRWDELAPPKSYHSDSRQLGMFMDRPDLWRRPKRKARSISPEQLTLEKKGD